MGRAVRFALRLAVVIGIAIPLSGCQTGSCRKVDTTLPKIVTPEQMDKKNNPSENDEKAKRAFVFKYDGTLQCNQGRRVPLKEMAGQLEGIKIFSMERKQDNLMHIQVCGSSTGMANVYEISADDKAAAYDAGFKPWDFQ